MGEGSWVVFFFLMEQTSEQNLHIHFHVPWRMRNAVAPSCTLPVSLHCVLECLIFLLMCSVFKNSENSVSSIYISINTTDLVSALGEDSHILNEHTLDILTFSF